jgi:hypothetical protein
MSIWASHLTEKSYYTESSRLYFWSIAEVFLEYGAHPPVWIRPLQNSEYIDDDINTKIAKPERRIITLKLGQDEVILDGRNSPLNNKKYWPQSLQQYNHPITFYDLLDIEQPHNAENVRRLLDRAQGPDPVTDPHLQRTDSCAPAEDVTDQKVAPGHTEGSLKYRITLWNLLREMILHPLLPWVLFGALFMWRSFYV